MFSLPLFKLIPIYIWLRYCLKISALKQRVMRIEKGNNAPFYHAPIKHRMDKVTKQYYNLSVTFNAF